MRGRWWTVKCKCSRILPKRALLFEGRDNCLGKIALTFDDGPSAPYTQEVLDILKKEKVPASFFFIGKAVKEHPEIVKRACQEGHLVGCHSYEHRPFNRLNTRELENDMDLCRKTFSDVTGTPVKYIRPPYGICDARSLFVSLKKGLTTVLWSIDSRDFKKPEKEHVLREILGHELRGGDIMLFHDTHAHTAGAVGELIPLLRSRGFSFVTVEDFTL